MFNHIICRIKRCKVSLIFFDNLQIIQPRKVEILFHWPEIANLRTVNIIYISNFEKEKASLVWACGAF